jgi:peptide/nickel transport system permease protein
VIKICFGSFVLLSFLVCAIFAPYLAPYSLDDTDLARRLLSPSPEHFLGCDLYGGDLLSGLLYGARTSLYVATLTLGLSFTVGIFLGLVSGYRGGLWDRVIMGIVDILLAFPGILLAMALSSLLGPSLHNVILSIGATGWTATTRLVRGQVLSLKRRDFVVATQSLGASTGRIFFYHLLPGILPQLVVSASFSFAGVILTEASLSFLGLGAQDGAPSWGGILNQGKGVLAEAPHVSFFPGIGIFFVILGCNFLGDGLRDRLDPKG